MNTRTVICLALVGTSLVLGRTADASVQFCNNSNQEIWTIISVATDGHDGQTCHGTLIPNGDYSQAEEEEVTGWFALNHSGCTTVSNVNLINFAYGLNNLHGFFFFATNSNWSEIWDSGSGGSGWSTAIETPAFDLCNPYGVVVGADGVPSPYFIESFGIENTGNANNFTLTFN
jgi:hypothetical protein